MTTRCAVLGRPVAHSLSPVLHRTAYDGLGLDWTYDAIEVDESGLAAFLDGLGPHWRGLSLTMPLKRAVLPLLDEADELVRRTGVANTVVLAGGRRRGHNTDVPGAVAALRERLGMDRPVPDAVVLGGGATATSVLFALADLGCAQVRVLARDPDRVAPTVAAARRHPEPPLIRVGRLEELVRTDVLVVSTIPAEAQTDALVAAVGGPVFEVRYDPWPTPLAAAAAARGATLVSGLDLLVHQAAAQVALMTGTPAGAVPVEAMRAAGERALAAAGGTGHGR